LLAKVVDKIRQTFYVQYPHTHTQTLCLKYGGLGQATANDIIQRLRFACWITKDKDADIRRMFSTYFFSRPQWLYEHPSVLTHTLPVL